MRIYIRYSYVLFVICRVNLGHGANVLDKDSNIITRTTIPKTKHVKHDSAVNESSVADEKCREYSKMISGRRRNSGLNEIYRSIEETYCNVTNLIIGGKRAAPKEFPHMALLGTYKKWKGIYWFCGGSLISDRWILTAAHCAYSITLTSSESPSWARLGVVNYVELTNTDDARPRDYEIIKVVIHPNYNMDSIQHDIALLRLGKDVEFSAYVRPICLNTDRSLEVEHALTVGWGQTKYGGPISVNLLKVALNIIPTDECNRMFSFVSAKHHQVDGVSQICAGYIEGGKDTCGGDSGGPLQIDHPAYACMHTQIGITSYGYKCAVKNTAGVYTRLSNYIPWIEQIVWPKNQ